MNSDNNLLSIRFQIDTLFLLNYGKAKKKGFVFLTVYYVWIYFFIAFDHQLVCSNLNY